MYACGLRASEAVGLELSELDLEAGILRARGKGSKERIVPIGSKAIEQLHAYLNDARPRLVGLRNLVHASDAPETAEAEIALWFPEGVVGYTRDLERWLTDEGAPS